MAQKHEYDFEMTCGGCSGAAKKVLQKIGVEEGQIEFDMENKKVFVTTDKTKEDIEEALKKTGKKVTYVGST